MAVEGAGPSCPQDLQHYKAVGRHCKELGEVGRWGLQGRREVEGPKSQETRGHRGEGKSERWGWCPHRGVGRQQSQAAHPRRVGADSESRVKEVEESSKETRIGSRSLA